MLTVATTEDVVEGDVAEGDVAEGDVVEEAKEVVVTGTLPLHEEVVIVEDVTIIMTLTTTPSIAIILLVHLHLQIIQGLHNNEVEKVVEKHFEKSLGVMYASVQQRSPEKISRKDRLAQNSDHCPPDGIAQFTFCDCCCRFVF